MKKLKYLSTLLVAALAIIAAWLVWNYYTQSPWTRDGKVRAEQVSITPQVSGSILQLNVRDNQLVKAGDVLFRIDDTPIGLPLSTPKRSWRKRKQKWPKRKRSKQKRPVTPVVVVVFRQRPSPPKIWKA
jgi:multidrug resistance efflux pump